MDPKTLLWMTERIGKANAINREIKYRKAAIERLGTEVTSIFFHTNAGNAEYTTKNRERELGFCSRLKIEAAKILIEEINILETKLEEI